MTLIAIPAMKDNYIWVLSNLQRESIIIDPGIARPVLDYLTKNNITPKTILLTHHHNDHVGGVYDILEQYPNIPVYGPLETLNKGCTSPVLANDKIIALDIIFQVLYVPGHTLGHLAYYAVPYLFCGDALFSAGCGRILEGTPQQMYSSLQIIARLPNNTLICCAHEYTESNLRFARFVLSKNKSIQEYQRKVRTLRFQNQPTLPSSLKLEKDINPFLRCHDNDLELNISCSNRPDSAWKIFALLREMKDLF
ncbi:hydroxyacylglutathione hydrolase [Candidatus Profftia tarda]|nr:hydroxyacylglutathione hydrolase [Candidatus Profftia tarda]